MAKNLASVKPVKCYGAVYEGGLIARAWRHPISDYKTHCTLVVTDRYKKLMDVVKAAQKWEASRSVMDAGFLVAAIEAAEKAGAL